MAIEHTLVIIKPDGVKKGEAVVEAIKQRYRDAGFKILYEGNLLLGWDDAWRFYEEHKGRSYWEGLLLAMSSDRSYALVLEGERAIDMVRTINGPTNPFEGYPGMIRFDFMS